MASWLTHLRIGEKVKETIKAIDKEYLMLGSIAPDSCIKDKELDNSIFVRNNQYLNYINNEKRHEYSTEEFFSIYMHPEKIITRSDTTRSFLWGYYFHLLTDKHWYSKYALPAVKSDSEGLKDFENEFAKQISEEKLAIDFIFLQDTNWNLLNEFKQIEVKVNFLPEINTRYIHDLREGIIELYSGEPLVLDREFQYLSVESVNEFVSTTAEKCIRTLL